MLWIRDQVVILWYAEMHTGVCGKKKSLVFEDLFWAEQKYDIDHNNYPETGETHSLCNIPRWKVESQYFDRNDG